MIRRDELAVAICVAFWQLEVLCFIAMSVVDRKQDLFENVVRLRRVGRDLPGNADVFAVRSALEQELGETVYRPAGRAHIGGQPHSARSLDQGGRSSARLLSSGSCRGARASAPRSLRVRGG